LTSGIGWLVDPTRVLRVIMVISLASMKSSYRKEWKPLLQDDINALKKSRREEGNIENMLGYM
jgi:hypothetical protein